MSFLTRLIDRHGPDGPTSVRRLEPRLASRFEPVDIAAGPEEAERDPAIETSRGAEARAPVARRPWPRPSPHDGDPLEIQESHVSARRPALSAARATVASPPPATMAAASPTGSSPTVDPPPAPASRRPPVEADSSSRVVSTPSPRSRRPVLEPVPDRRPAPPAAPAAAVERERPAPREQPTIHVSIGRVDVRAVVAPAVPSARPAPAVPRLSLEDYLRGRQREPR
jgi:hypothetical protein